MATLTSNIVTAAAAIVKMNNDMKEQMLLAILSKHPLSTMKVLETEGTNFGMKLNKPIDKFYRVILDEKGNDKIALIRICREITGYGLASAKDWSEGKSFDNMHMPPGVFHTNRTLDEAQKLVNKINSVGSGILASYIEMNKPVPPLRNGFFQFFH